MKALKVCNVAVCELQQTVVAASHVHALEHFGNGMHGLLESRHRFLSQLFEIDDGEAGAGTPDLLRVDQATYWAMTPLSSSALTRRRQAEGDKWTRSARSTLDSFPSTCSTLRMARVLVSHLVIQDQLDFA